MSVSVPGVRAGGGERIGAPMPPDNTWQRRLQDVSPFKTQCKAQCEAWWKKFITSLEGG